MDSTEHEMLLSGPFSLVMSRHGAFPANRPTRVPLPRRGDLPLDVVVVAGVVPLQLLLHIVQHHHGSDEVHRLARREQVQVVPTVPAPVPVASRVSRENVFSSQELTNTSFM